MLLFSLAGIPPLAGFFAKFYVFNAAIQAHLYWLAVVGVVLSVIGAYYYLRIVKIMYFDEPGVTFEPIPASVQFTLARLGGVRDPLLPLSEHAQGCRRRGLALTVLSRERPRRHRRVLHFESLDSTNEEALRRLAARERTRFGSSRMNKREGAAAAAGDGNRQTGNLYATLVSRRGVSASSCHAAFLRCRARRFTMRSPAICPCDQHSALAPEMAERRHARRLRRLAGILLESVAAPKGKGPRRHPRHRHQCRASRRRRPSAPWPSLGLAAPRPHRRFRSARIAPSRTWLARWDEGRGFAGDPRSMARPRALL